MDVELVVEKVREDAQGNEVISYQFRPINPVRRSSPF
jgi:hypothetical protein